MENHYRILGLENFASFDEIKRAYRQLVKKYHPDRNGGKDDQFKRVSEAYRQLINPEKKAVLDQWLSTKNHRKQFVTPPNHSSASKPKYAKRTVYYTSEKKVYSSRTKLYGLLFTLALITVCTLFAIGLMYKASNYAYSEALVYYNNGQFTKASYHLNRAITWLGQRSGEASILAARIGLYHLKNTDQASFFINKGLEYSWGESHVAELHFLLGKRHKLLGEADSALNELNMAAVMGYDRDSIIYERALINAFFKDEFERASKGFAAFLLRHPEATDALFGQAWCAQKRNKPLESISLYNELISRDSTHVLGLFYRGHNHIVLGDTLSACNDFQSAYVLGYAPALVYLTNQCQ